MDTKKISAALETAKKELHAVVEAEFKAGRFGAMKGLASVSATIERAEERLVKASTPKAKKVKKAAPTK